MRLSAFEERIRTKPKEFWLLKRIMQRPAQMQLYSSGAIKKFTDFHAVLDQSLVIWKKLWASQGRELFFPSNPNLFSVLGHKKQFLFTFFQGYRLTDWVIDTFARF